ncbi:RpiB/LacA/LacB family sugar-phosphate isomerase [Candidatus Cytomitobacter primus]|uniref:RpiB/LacA/LacB family sugar-phosphate isomerase n=1 Tax=Candidatus Cytomitobacter primus TaxID=2066024 RepID=UPI001653D680|nr:RpiB/LacA/LacB family sugar-phosphate isomerase [Candidatus Cytomitobacter primus]
MSVIITNIIIGSDHRGFELKEYIIKNKNKVIQNDLHPQNKEMIDIGCYDNKEIDFTDIVFDMIDKWAHDSIGILICKTGIGMSICANRFPNIRGAICKNSDDIISARSHNNANVLILGAQNDNDEIIEMINLFIDTEFRNDAKYSRRVDKISQIK